MLGRRWPWTNLPQEIETLYELDEFALTNRRVGALLWAMIPLVEFVERLATRPRTCRVALVFISRRRCLSYTS